MENIKIDIDKRNMDKEVLINKCFELEKAFGCSKEKQTIINEFEKLMNCLESRNEDNRDVQLYLKLGEMYQVCGKIDTCIKFQNQAHLIAVKLDDKILQVDTLIKIIEGYFMLGKVEESENYAKKAEMLLRDLEYVKGKLEISLCLIKVYYFKSQYFKAREVGNEALKLCSEEHYYYKGRILNAMAITYSELIDYKEHLDLLHQALECFEKADFLRGVLGTINNIGTVYLEKIQNNEKAMQYFQLLREKSESAGLIEFQVYAYFNIGDAFYKDLKYKEAIFWCEKAKELARVAELDHIVFHSFIELANIYLELKDYNEAQKYFQQCQKIMENHPHKGESIPLYYKMAATFYLETQDIEKAKIYIKQALEAIGTEESMIKWNIGLLYEFIKLRSVNSISDIQDAINGIRFIISKYRIQKVVVKSIRYTLIILSDIGQQEMAVKLFNEYRQVFNEIDFENFIRTQ